MAQGVTVTIDAAPFPMNEGMKETDSNMRGNCFT